MSYGFDGGSRKPTKAIPEAGGAVTIGGKTSYVSNNRSKA
jgi:hypothetical protein